MGMNTTALTFVLAGLAASSASAAPPPKTAICHGTGSDQNPYVLIEVRESLVQGHLDHTAPGHHGEPAARPDFEWDPALYDDGCNPLPPSETLLSSCTDDGFFYGGPLEVVYDDGQSSLLDCPGAHSYVELPPGVDHIVCQQGDEAIPHWHRFQMINDDWEGEFGVTCVAGETRRLGIEAGPFQMVCDMQGYYTMSVPDGLGNWISAPIECTAGHTLNLDWNMYHRHKPQLGCPQSGYLVVAFPGYGEPYYDILDFEMLFCDPGDRVDLSQR